MTRRALLGLIALLAVLWATPGWAQKVIEYPALHLVPPGQSELVGKLIVQGDQVQVDTGSKIVSVDPSEAQRLDYIAGVLKSGQTRRMFGVYGSDGVFHANAIHRGH